jgi:hypothetical protein
MLGQSVTQQPYVGMQPVMQSLPGAMQVANCPTFMDTLASYKWIIIAIIAALIYMRYFNKKPKEEEEKK